MHFKLPLPSTYKPLIILTNFRTRLQNQFAVSNYESWENLFLSDKGGNIVDILLSISKALNQVQKR